MRHIKRKKENEIASCSESVSLGYLIISEDLRDWI